MADENIRLKGGDDDDEMLTMQEVHEQNLRDRSIGRRGTGIRFGGGGGGNSRGDIDGVYPDNLRFFASQLECGTMDRTTDLYIAKRMREAADEIERLQLACSAFAKPDAPRPAS